MSVRGRVLAACGACLAAILAPATRAAESKIPVPTARGSDDVRVPLRHGAKMLAARRAAGQNPEHVVYSGEGRGVLKMQSRVDFYTRLETFLAKDIGH